MISLHGTWYASRFHLWGEHAPFPPDAIAQYPDAEVALGPRPHPFAAGAEELQALLGEVTADGLLASAAGAGQMILWLPSRTELASGTLMAGSADPVTPASSRDESAAADSPGGHRLLPWLVPTMALEPADAVDLLTSLAANAGHFGAPHADWRCGDTLAYWARLGQYLVRLLSRGRFVPDLQEAAPSGYYAAWRLVVEDRQELSWLERLAAAMPPVCRAWSAASGAAPPAGQLSDGFLAVCADAVVRRNLAADSFFQQIHERARGDAAWEVRWLSALSATDPCLLPATEETIASFHHVRAWLSRVEAAESTIPPRLVFELSEPAPADCAADALPLGGAIESTGTGGLGSAPSGSAGGPHWRVRFYLLAQDGTGERFDPARMWAEQPGSSLLGRRPAGSGLEFLRAELARAIEAFPLLDRALQSAAPTGLDLSTPEAYAFLRDGAPLLEARGFGVSVPGWAAGQAEKLGLRLVLAPANPADLASPVTAGALGLNALVNFEWRVAIGGSELTGAEFEQLRARQDPLVRLGGRWVQFDAETAERAAEFLARRRAGQTTLGAALRAAAGVEDLPAGLPVYGVSGVDWLDSLLRLDGDDGSGGGLRWTQLPQPPGFAGTLRRYQADGLSWMVFMERVGLGACLADDMGLGKTIQLIALLLEERQAGRPVGPTLIFAPMSVVGNWQRELERFAGQLRVQVHHGPDRLGDAEFPAAVRDMDAVVTTYALGHRDLDTLRKVHWHRIVLDEAQKIKNPSAAQTVAIRSLPATHRVALTGTPLENHLSELWSIMEMLNPGLLGAAADFRRRFGVPIERLGDQQKARELRALVRPFLLRRVKSDPHVECDLPEKMEMRVYCNLTPEQAALYEQVVADALSAVESAAGIRRRGVILAALTKLKQICNHPSHYTRDQRGLDGRSGKCERLTEMLEEALAEGDAALVFTQFREMGHLLQTMLHERLDREVLFLHGGSPNHKRQEMIDRFQDPAGGPPIFVLSLRAGGLGLNLTAANHVFHFDRWWNPAVEDQATDRAHRIGQTRRVQVHKFVCIGTIEERIDRLLADKIVLADSIVGSGDEWLTGLSTEELRRYLTLSKEAIGEP